MTIIEQQRAQVRDELFQFSMDVLKALGASQEQQAKEMPAMLVRSYEIESSLTNAQVKKTIAAGPSVKLLKKLKLI